MGKAQIYLAFRSLNRITLAAPKLLSLGKVQINLAFRSLNRTTLAAPKLLSLGKVQINLAFRSLNRNFAVQIKEIWTENKIIHSR